MSNYVIQRHCLCMSDPAPFNQHWEARVVADLSKIDVGAALQPCITSLKAGDQLSITAFTKNDWRVISQVATFRVVSVAQTVRVVLIGAITDIPAQDLERFEIENLRLKIVQRGSSFVVCDEQDNEIEAFSDLEQAETFKRREEGRPVPVIKKAEPPKTHASKKKAA